MTPQELEHIGHVYARLEQAASDTGDVRWLKLGVLLHEQPASVVTAVIARPDPTV